MTSVSCRKRMNYDIIIYGNILGNKTSHVIKLLDKDLFRKQIAGNYWFGKANNPGTVILNAAGCIKPPMESHISIGGLCF